MRFVFLAFFFFLTPMANAVTCQQLNTLWRTKFHSDFKANWQKKDFACPSADAKVAKALYDVYEPKLSFDYYRWATNLVTVTRYNPDCRAGVVASMRSDGRMTLCPAFYRESASSRAGTIVHEASHADDTDPGHVTCSHGSSKGSAGGCDRKFYDGWDGSGYNHEFVYYRDLLKQTDYKDLDKAMIRTYMKYLVLNRFNEITSEQVKKWTAG